MYDWHLTLSLSLYVISVEKGGKYLTEIVKKNIKSTCTNFPSYLYQFLSKNFKYTKYDVNPGKAPLINELNL